jgi:hypothetical protein
MKLDLCRVLLPECPFIRIDATRPDVDVPDFLRTDELTLRIGENAARRQRFTFDLALDARGFSGRIVRNVIFYPVCVPWSAVYGMWLEGDQHGPEVMVGLRTGEIVCEEPPRRGGHLRVV